MQELILALVSILKFVHSWLKLKINIFEAYLNDIEL
jgi:hypothetical protein